MRSYRTRAAARYLGVSKSFLDKQAIKRKGPAYRKPGGRIRIYDEPDLDDYKLATRVEPESDQHPATPEV